MRSALIDRRDFIRAAGVAFLTGLAPEAAFALTRADAVFATGVRKTDRSFALALMAEDGAFIAEIALPDRIHGLAVSPADGRAVAFARRPGTFAVAFDPAGAIAPSIFHTPENRHFYGHGAFSPDGLLLYASENDFDARRGVVGLYDARNGFARIGEFPTYGVGPHDLTVTPDGRFLIAANGGIETHPDFGRTKLNPDHMQPSLALIDAATGTLVEKHDLPPELSQLSTRHLALGGNGRIWFACQFEGPRNETPPLVGRFAPGEALSFAALPEDVTIGLGNYVGAIACNSRDGLIGLSSPKGEGMVVRLDEATGRFVSSERLANAAGIAPAAHGFAVGTYDGLFGGRRHDLAFDQHIIRLADRPA
ncbi:DUF1513 domain-containing protein [Martelella endophytica]|uniref:DUF1513 domain-containing protein n=1 Tax=Martelella endophytica TaxID=1486262 RepID=A0A0D5LNM4_MAREN|nr:DUF1513 domain-containing protein [Martelella endophytica]AJY45746.1 hypothetical protein TM49_08710 [Martelella endophytica]